MGGQPVTVKEWSHCRWHAVHRWLLELMPKIISADSLGLALKYYHSKFHSPYDLRLMLQLRIPCRQHWKMSVTTTYNNSANLLNVSSEITISQSFTYNREYVNVDKFNSIRDCNCVAKICTLYRGIPWRKMDTKEKRQWHAWREMV